MSIASSYLPGALAWAVSAADARGYARERLMTPADEVFERKERADVDAKLLRRMAAGDRNALAELYDRFSRPLYATALHIINDASEAQDIIQDVFIALWEKASVFESERGTAFSWAVTLVRNRAIDRFRSRKRHNRLLEESTPADLGYREDSDGPAADDSAALGDDARAVRAAVDTLPADQQRALKLAFFSGLTQQEIAERIQEPLGTVKARIRRGLLKLRETIERRP